MFTQTVTSTLSYRFNWGGTPVSRQLLISANSASKAPAWSGELFFVGPQGEPARPARLGMGGAR